MKKYAVLDPMSGQYIYKDTIESATDTIADIAINLYLNHHCHGQLYGIVDIDESGVETWSSQAGVSQPSPSQIEQSAKLAVKHKVMPVSILGGK